MLSPQYVLEKFSCKRKKSKTLLSSLSEMQTIQKKKKPTNKRNNSKLMQREIFRIATFSRLLSLYNNTDRPNPLQLITRYIFYTKPVREKNKNCQGEKSNSTRLLLPIFNSPFQRPHICNISTRPSGWPVRNTVSAVQHNTHIYPSWPNPVG